MGQPSIPLHLTPEDLLKLTLSTREDKPGLEPEVILLLDGEPVEEASDDQ